VTSETTHDGGFGPDTTAGQVLAGVDLGGATALVTGGYSGIGLETTLALAGAGARVVVPARRPGQARRVLADAGPGVVVDELDLADLGSVRAFADRFRRDHAALDVLVANAGVMACPETRVGPGWEAQFAVNHLGHYALANLLWPALTAAGGGRVVCVTSGYDASWRIRWDDPHFRRGYDKWQAYTQSKLAAVLFARHLDLLGAPHGVHAFSANPGWILTPLQRHLTRPEMIAAGWVDAAGKALPGLFKTVEQGAATQVWAATSPGLAAYGGAYCADCGVALAEPADAGQAARLWALSAELTGLDAAG
jgi:NAD(P)-dependent dehydrogenase (short-subunit alcohol dehydrogenase family)